MPAMNANNQTVEIDLFELFYVLRNKWKTLLLALIIGAAILAGYHAFFVKDIYEATTKIYITNKDNNLSYQDLQIGSALAEDYKAIIVSRPVLNRVIEDLKLEMNYGDLRKMITVTNPTGTHIIYTRVRTADKEKSRIIANDLLDVSMERINDIVSTGSKPSVIEHSEVEAIQKVTPSLIKYTAIGGLIGFLIAAAYICIGVIMDDSIRSDDDVAKYLQLPVLSAVPYYKD